MAGIPLAKAQVEIRNFRPSAAEMRQLPPYCAVKFNSSMDSSEWKMWRSQLGPNFNDVHHYCAGLNFLNRYYRAPPSEKGGMLQGAKRNFEYMMGVLPEFPLRADIFLNHGITMKLMGQAGLAVKDLQQAIAINPKLTKAYLELVSVYRDSKQSAQAMDIVVAGLRQVPDSKTLQRHYLELGGKPPFPEPAAAEAAATATQAQPEQAPPAADSQPVPPAATDAVETTPVIGTPGNPYCRFCPPPEMAR
jgi:tetratricopeptide (TPR) repeat protein